MMSTEESILQRIRPSEEEIARVDSAAESLKKAVREYMDAHDIEADLIYVGSYAKNTYLDGNDLDLFMAFPRTVPKDEMLM